MPREKWEGAGIAVAPARRDRLTLTKWVTGKVTPNEDRLAHIYSLVEGIVHEVRVRYGDRVRAGDVLAVVDSVKVGEAKLALVQDRLDVRIAEVNLDWKQTIAENTRALIEALEQGIAPQEIAERFQGRPMGAYREQLVSAYARLHQARAEYERDRNLYEQRRAISEQQFLRTKADFEAAQATSGALMEQSRFTIEQELIQARQALEAAQVAEGTSRSALYILGYGEDEVAALDPLGQGEEVAHYAIAAPFDGTIIAKDVVRDERVGPDTRLFDLTDLSTVWTRADIYEQDLPYLEGLGGGAIRFRAGAYPDRLFEAKVFYAGDVVDPETRTVRMMAVADSHDGTLKPGMFVEVELPIGTADDVVQVPKSAIQADEGRTFVFVQHGAEEFARRDVAVGREGADVVEIIEGLQGGEPIAVRGTFALKAEMMRGELAEGGHSH
ncbi:efflux RND transporter periplasmic adaptor subunit [Tautonia sociabilis]|nr:efflux RND transporter periplasmic adaptor subunit [Tautonia sociabilis]